MKYHRIEFCILDREGNWKPIDDALFPGRHHTKAEEAAKNSKWADGLRKTHPGEKYYIGWKGED